MRQRPRHAQGHAQEEDRDRPTLALRIVQARLHAFMIYALALTKLATLRLFDIKCAWFDEEEYCEFFPRTLLARRRADDKAVA